jgi:glucose-6-phosphate isomerase
MALVGINIREFLQGAAAMDASTRSDALGQNMAGMLALNWLHATGGVGARAMVVLPYKDRLCLFSRYLQQLIMESLGKATDLEGNPVSQGITVYGNKGSTDQHAYVQQLRDGLDNFFVNFVEVLDEGGAVEVDPGIFAGDYLQGFAMGTARALAEKGRPSMTLTLREVSAFTIGALIALFERAVGFYADFVNINAYHQPGVEAGKKAAGELLKLKSAIVELLKASGTPLTLAQIVEKLAPADADFISRILQRLCLNPHHNIVASDPANPFNSTYAYGKILSK